MKILKGMKTSAWKYRIMLILQENDLDKFVKQEVLLRETSYGLGVPQ